ncbi:Anthranilate 1,2-dioxygenase ferredoxin subunit [Rubripirellula lacrimiformis]|uniref:Anthranilate 1,2-dioxygenase ferredoxin subunit n=1 Tax=Rubripirellula lacrimiformis TaxID=1930273 RepID=A0A517NAY4_9BACT|nr:Rieske (2Fe-2S) protein [Rubripirellula lacrimiformis]QDT04293.1 Anthranilate 1,2-dioxygenase ferredoxin subunit [Rubripirellula lacrimiformis]
MNHQWTPVAQASEIADGEAIEVVVGEQILAIFRSDGQWFAMDGMCAHQGGPIAQGKVADGCVTCPWHGWQYDLATGIQTINRQPLMQTFPIREVDGTIEVELEK